MSKTFDRFGRYLILDHLVDGGMAKICRARFLGEQANKVVAIKMIQAQYSKDEAFRQMFEDELKVTFGLNHPNIAQTYDYGMQDGQLFTAMEYVDGANLKQYMDRLKQRKFVFPVDVTTFIIGQVCQALHYAHTFTDKLTGKPFNIIHRDISPHNIMLSYDGTVKVIDFGIAKAETNSEATQAGTIKGKLSYLAPEYISGKQLDVRYDLFAVGITMWELLCNRRLFTAANDIAVLKLIEACNVPPPSSINKNVPKELDAIVMKALARDREQRYKDLDQFNRVLVKFLYSNYPEFNPSDLVYFAKELFKEDIQSDRALMREYGKIDIAPYLEALREEKTSGVSSAVSQVEDPSTSTDSKSVDPASKSRLIELETKGESGLEIAGPPPTPSRQTRSTTRPGPAKNSAAGQDPSKTSAQNTQRRERTSTSIRPVQKDKKSGSSTIIALAVAGLAGLAFVKKDMLIGMISGKKGSTPESVIDTTEIKTESKKAPARLILNNLDPYMEVYVNGERTRYTGLGIEIPRETEVRLIVRKEGHLPFRKSFTVPKMQSSVVLDVPDLNKERIGMLTTSNKYTDGSIIKFLINGQQVEKELPLRNYRLPAGVYEATIFDPLVGSERNVRFEIEENKRFFLD